jgi:hypothetical protein
VAQQQAVWDALDEWREVGVSADFDRRLRLRIANEEKLTSWWRRSWRPALPVAAAAILLSVALWLNQPRAAQVVAPAPMHHTQPSGQIESLQHALNDMDMLVQISPI